MRMNLLALAVDNVSELLVKIIEFTQTRQKTLIQNINNIHSPDFVPKEMAVEEFSALLHEAIDEHTQNRRLLLRDTENIKFGPNGSFKVKPIVDEYAKELLEEDPDEYLGLQINKLLENSLNQRLAAELLMQRREASLTLS
jgi:flagellar basal body rod protein FlgB